MATELVPTAAITERALRKRIHRLFSSDRPRGKRSSAAPHFWVVPTEEQKNTITLEIHERIELRDQADIRPEEQSEEQQWLNSPHVDLDGRSPEAMLTDDECSRQRLDSFIAAIEAAVQQGSFS